MLRALAVTTMLLLAVSAYAQDYQNGLDAHSSGDYATALSEWRPLAEAGDATAQFKLGSLYYFGQGVSQDYVEAAQWFRLAAEQGNATAQHVLGLMYYNDDLGVVKDYGEAARWFRLAAEQGNTEAQGLLGFMYAKGLGVAQDNVQSHYWFYIAAELGLEDAAKVRDAAAGELPPADIAKAERLAHEWLEAHQ